MVSAITPRARSRVPEPDTPVGGLYISQLCSRRGGIFAVIDFRRTIAVGVTGICRFAVRVDVLPTDGVPTDGGRPLKLVFAWIGLATIVFARMTSPSRTQCFCPAQGIGPSAG